VVGTGGESHYAIWGPIANSEVHNDDTYGVLKLTLRPSSYYWKFVPVAGQSFTDSGTTSCH
jgi:acid phosphatase type 7